MRYCFSTIAAFALMSSLAWGQAQTVVRSPADKQYLFAQGLYQQGFFDLAAGQFAKFAEQFPEDARREAAVFYTAQSLFQSGKEQRAAALAALQKYQVEYSESQSQFYDTSFYLLGEIHFQKAEEAISAGTPTGEEALSAEARKAYGEALTAYLRCAELCTRQSPAKGGVATALSRAAYCASRLGKWEQAAGAYQSLADRYQSVRAQFMVGETLYRVGQTNAEKLSDAIRAYRRVAFFGDNALEDDAAIGLAWCLYKQGNLNECRNYLGKQIGEGLFARLDRDFMQKASKLPEAYYLLGLCSSELGDTAGAIKWFRLLSKHPECRFRGDGLARLGKLLGPNVDRSTGEGAEISHATGRSFMEAGEFSEAAAEFERLYKSYPKMATASFRDQVLYDWAACYERLGYYREALAILGYLSRRSSQMRMRAEAAWAEAACYRELAGEANDPVAKNSRELEAIAALKRYADNTVTSQAEEALAKVGESYRSRKMYARAIAVYEELLLRFPQSSLRPEILLPLGRCYVETKDHRKAASLFEQCRRDYPSSVEAVFATEEMAVLSAKMSEYQGALVEYSRLQPESFPGLSKEAMEASKGVFENAAYSRGLLREKVGDVPGAISELELFILQYPSSNKVEAARLRLARLHFEQGEYEKSIQILRGYSDEPEKCPDLETALVTLVRSYLKLGRPDDAMARVTQAFASPAGAELPPAAFAQVSRIMEKEGQTAGARLPYSLLIERQQKLHDAMTAAASNATEMIGKKEYAKAVHYCSDIIAIHAPGKAPEATGEVVSLPKPTRETAVACLRRLEEIRAEARRILRTAFWELGKLNLRLGEPAAAAQAFESLAAIKPPTKQHFDVLFEAGSAWKKAGELQKALGDFEEIVRFSSKPADSLRAQLAIGNLWLESGNARRSLGTYLRIINFYDAEDPLVRPWAARALLQSGIAFDKLSRTDDARRQFEILVRDFGGEVAFTLLVEEAKRRLGQLKGGTKTDSVSSS